MNFYEKVLLVLVTFIFPILMLHIQDAKLIVIYLLLFVCWENGLGDKYFKYTKEHPLGYNFVILLMQAMHLLIIVGYSSLAMVNIIRISSEVITFFITTLFALCFILYMLISVAVIFYIGNYLFFFILKCIFPNQLEIESETNYLSLREMSSYLTIEEQIGYFITIILHLISYFGVVLYVTLWLLQINNTINGISYFTELVKWSIKHQIVSLGNGLGIASIIITLLSLSVPAQMKLHSKAIKRKNNKATVGL